MPSYELQIVTQTQCELVDITAQVEDCVHRSGVTSGVCIVFVPHTTAGLICNENCDPDVAADLLLMLDRLVPQRLPVGGPGYAHVEGNSAAHVKSSLLGVSSTVLVERGRLAWGTWQGLFLAEFDGPRRRRVLVRVLRDVE